MTESREREAFKKWCPIKIIDAAKAPKATALVQAYWTAWQAGRTPLLELLEEAKHVSQTIRMYMRDDFRYLDERDRAVLDELESWLERVRKELE
jgi:hypothetical protein